MTPAPRMPRVRSGGATVVEFAVILPLAVTVMFGAIEAGRMVACRQMLTYAAMEGGRTAAALGTADVAAVQTAVQGVSPLLNLSTSAIVVQALAGGCGGAAIAYTARVAGDCVRVTLTYTFSPMLAGAWWPTGRVWTDVQTHTVL